MDIEEYGFVHGRFQIFHYGHLEYVLKAKKRCENLIIGITSPDSSVSPAEITDYNRGLETSNPCTYVERMFMIKKTLEAIDEIDMKNIFFVPLPIGKPELIKYYVPSYAVSYCTVYDAWGDEKIKRINSLGYKTEVMWRDRVKEISGTFVRQLIINNEEWISYVPKPVYDYVTKHAIDARIRSLANK